MQTIPEQLPGYNTHLAMPGVDLNDVRPMMLLSTACMTEPYKHAQNRLLCNDKTHSAHTWLIMSWKA